MTHESATTPSATLTDLIARFRAREAVGLAKYGNTLDRKDLSAADLRQHLLEELMDACLYLVAEQRAVASQPAAQPKPDPAIDETLRSILRKFDHRTDGDTSALLDRVVHMNNGNHGLIEMQAAIIEGYAAQAEQAEQAVGDGVADASGLVGQLNDECNGLAETLGKMTVRASELQIRMDWLEKNFIHASKLKSGGFSYSPVMALEIRGSDLASAIDAEVYRDADKEQKTVHPTGELQADALATPRPAVATPVEVMDALNWVDDFIARCNGDDVGSCGSVNTLRAALTAQRPAPVEVGDGLIGYVHPALLDGKALAIEVSPMRLSDAQVPVYTTPRPAVATPAEVTDEVRDLLSEIARYAPMDGVLSAPTAMMGFGSRAKRLLAALTAQRPAGVPDALPEDAVIFGDGDDDGYRMGWNACRKAMLAAAPEVPRG